MSDVLVLCYHAVSPTWAAPLSVTEDALERQLSRLVAHGWRGATFSQAMLDTPGDRTLVVTFDDAFASVRERAEPILTHLGLPATVFAPTAFMGRRQPLLWDGLERWLPTGSAHELTSMDWSDLSALAQQGWEIASHTHTHPHLTTLDDRAARDELERSREECQATLRQPCRAIAYPYGEADDRIGALAQQAGYQVGARLSRSLARSGPYSSPRIGVYHRDSNWRFRMKMSGLTRAVRASRLCAPAGTTPAGELRWR